MSIHIAADQGKMAEIALNLTWSKRSEDETCPQDVIITKNLKRSI